MALSVTGIGHDSYPTTVEDYRNLIATLLPGSGAIGLNQFTVTPIAQEAGLAVEIGPGRTVVGGSAATDQGSYFVWSSTPETLAWPGPSGQPRTDALVLTVADGQYGTVEEQGPAWLIVQGTASTNPTPPTVADITAATPAAGWLRIADIRVNPEDTSIAPANITRTLGPHDGGWRPLSLPSGITTHLGQTPAYRIIGEQVFLTGGIARTNGADFTDDQTFGGAVLATVPPEACPPHISYGTFQSLARRSQANFVGGGLLRGEVRANGEIYAYRDNMEYTTTWIRFHDVSYWLAY